MMASVHAKTPIMKLSAPKTAFAMVETSFEVGRRRFCWNWTQERRRELNFDSALGLSVLGVVGLA